MAMKHFIFVSDQGTTYQPSSLNEYPNIIENLQVIGFSSGTNHGEAFTNLLTHNSHLKATAFSNIFGIETNSEDGQDRQHFTIPTNGHP